MKTLYILFFSCAFILHNHAQVTSDNLSSRSKEDPIQSLKAIVPQSPAVPSSDVVILMDQVGSTQTLEAVYLLVECFVFNFSPSIIDESLSQDEMIPAISIIKRHFGQKACPLIFYQAVNTKSEWMRERAALAIQTIASPQYIEALKLSFSLSSSNNQNVREFGKLLETLDLIIYLYDPEIENEE